MAEVFTNEGLGYILNGVPRASVLTATWWVGLFTSQSAASVNAPPGVWASVTEVSGGGYVRQALPAASWGAPASTATGMKTTGAQVSFPETTAAYSPTHGVNGYFIITTAAAGASGILVGQANFDDGQPVIVNSAGIVVKVSPGWQANC